MKATKLQLLMLVAGLLALAGCHQSQSTDPAPVFNGVKVDLPKLAESFATAGTDLQEIVSRINHHFRYGFYPQAVAELEKLAKNPSLTAAQKQIVADLIEQTKQVIAKPAGTPK